MTENREIVKSRKPKLFYKKRNKSDKFFARLTRKKKKTHITRIRNEGGNITTNLVRIKRIMREHYEQLYTNK